MIFNTIRKRLKLFSILSSLIVLLPVDTSIQACGFSSEHEEVRYMVFNPDLLENKRWWTFFYNSKLTYLDGQVSSDDDERVLSREWVDYLHARGTPEEAEAYIFGALPDSLKGQNAFFLAVQKSPAAKRFFELGERASAFSLLREYWSDETDGKSNDQDASDEIAALLKMLTAERDTFMIRKYAFQLVKLAYYVDARDVFDRAYNRYFNNTPVNVLDWWAVHFKSMMLERENATDSANYLHARVFSNTSAKMFASRQAFSSRNLPAVLSLAESDMARADVLVLAQAINPGRSLESIRKIYSLAPEHRHWPLLISREINKIEDWLGSPRYAGVSIATEPWEEPSLKNLESDKAYLVAFTQALESFNLLAAKQPDFYYSSLSYLYLLQNNPAKAWTCLERVSSDHATFRYQKEVLQIIHLTQTRDIARTDTQEELGRRLQTLISERTNQFESQKILYSLFSYLRYSFAQKGQIHIAGLLDNMAVNKFCFTCTWNTFEYSLVRYFDKHASVADVDKLVTLLEKPEHNALEKILVKPYSNINYVYDLLAVKHLRIGNTRQAEAVLRKIPDDFWFTYANAIRNLDRDPFLDNRELLSVQTMTLYNKREIVTRLNALEDEAAQSPERRAANYFRLGNAWYNFTEHAWFMLGYATLGTDDFKLPGKPLARQRALDYYQKSLALEQDREVQAKLAYMIFLLSPDQNRKRAARGYEQYEDTHFYSRRNCFTAADLAGM